MPQFDAQPGRDLALVRNDTTGAFDFSWDSYGNPVFDDTETHGCMSLLLEERGAYWADDSGKRGSLLHTRKLDFASTKTDLENDCQEALDYAVGFGRITNVTAVAKRERPGKYVLDVRWKTRRGLSASTRLPITK